MTTKGHFTAAQCRTIAAFKAHWLSNDTAQREWVNDFSSADLEMSIPVHIVPGLTRLGHEATFVKPTNSGQLGAKLEPGEQLFRFFKLINMHPRDAFTAEMFELHPAPFELVGMREGQRLNRHSIQVIRGYLDLLESDVKVSTKRDALLSMQEAGEVMQASQEGGYPALMGMLTLNTLLGIDFKNPVLIDGEYGAGFYTPTMPYSAMAKVHDTSPFPLHIDAQDVLIPDVSNATTISQMVLDTYIELSQ